ncbi:hypothetical protein P691DRAFT_788325 [Macrolepiota fuliginosa MF-IS2]|uniref:Uncharacterized protein n=1 Tax=Macrolepiota fuliginosa MF-IS2 TaxID=1400762 RepID=A0A9P6BZ58_9AGAR|nr:hypothetical protein P691DRAFT_788325 [Macrolepiota fuliginosa MF-IS2]
MSSTLPYPMGYYSKSADIDNTPVMLSGIRVVISYSRSSQTPPLSVTLQTGPNKRPWDGYENRKISINDDSLPMLWARDLPQIDSHGRNSSMVLKVMGVDKRPLCFNPKDNTPNLLPPYLVRQTSPVPTPGVPYFPTLVTHGDRSPEAGKTCWFDQEVQNGSIHVNYKPQFSSGKTREVINTELEYRDIPRAVVSPVISDMPGYTGHMWGAAREDLGGVGEGRMVHFVDSMAAATNPPQASLWIMTPQEETLLVGPRVGNAHVSVGDVQRAVIAWMRRIEYQARTEGRIFGLTQRKLVQIRDRTVMEVVVWMWRGLLQVGGRLDLWAIQL